MAAAPSDPRAAAAKAAAFAAIEQAFGQEVDFLKTLVRHPSTRGQTNGVQHLVAATLHAMGLRVDEVPVEPERIAGRPGFSPADWPYDGLFQVVGTLPAAGAGGMAATGGRSLILNGHVDVVSPEPVGHWTRDPWAGEVAGGRMYGRGTGDMKAGVGAMIYALKAVQAAGIGLGGDVLVETVLDEECGGNGTLALLAQGYRAGAAVIPEPSGLGLTRAHLGVLWCRIRVRGRAAHAGAASRAVNAVEKAYVVLQAIKTLEAEANRPEARHPLYAAVEHPLNYNVGVIHGGDWPSSVPEACTLEVRFACYPGEALDAVQARLCDGVLRAAAADDWLREHPPELTFFGFRGEGAVYDLDGDLVRAVAASHAQVLGTPLPVGVSTASDDRRFFQLYHGIPAVCYGPIGGQLHAVDEWVDLESLRACTCVLAGVLIDWCGVA
ncbi:MAG: ArgE/DapE family deacylase [Chloroflexi bacterium]|nr:ArgE/DapE family deacylase [Chloroflexota bacterium]